MKLQEILNESATDIVARFYKEAGKDFDEFYNRDVAKYKKKSEEYYNEYFSDWFKNGKVPVFEKPVDKVQPEFTSKPKNGKIQSPGYRGLQYALAAAGLPYNHDVQRYKPDSSRMLASQANDIYKNSNN